MPQPLSQTQLKELARHSREGTAVAAGRLRRFLADSRWIGKTNAYTKDVTLKLRRDRMENRAPSTRNLGQYIAASGPLHAVDGWAFVARALDAAAKGDPDAARHLGYYAELRGAVSLLASQGIGVFNGPHAVVEPSGDARVLTGPGTHEMAWLALRYWMRTAESAHVLGGLVGQGGYAIESWSAGLPGGNPWSAIGANWLRSWGLDLRDGFHDRGARNKASYAPTRFYNARAISALSTKRFLSEWWAVLEPARGVPFEGLDRHLLRATLEDAFHATRGIDPASNPVAFRTDVATAKAAVTGDGSLDDALGQFLTRAVQPDTCSLLSNAERRDAPDVADQHLQVISRATLLLRLASAAAADLLQRAGIESSALDFWVRAVGEDRALWEPGGEPDDLTDLWADVEAALVDLAELQPPEPGSYRALQDRCARALAVMAGAERVALWAAAA